MRRRSVTTNVSLILCSISREGILNCPGHSSVTGTSRNDFFPGCFLAPGFLSGQNRRIPIGSYRFQKGPGGDRLENYRIVRKHPTGIWRQRTSRKRLGNGQKRRKPAGSDTEIAGTGRFFEVPATGLIDLGGEIEGEKH